MPSFTLDAMAAFETGSDFTLDSVVKARISSSFALDAYVMQPGAVVRSSFFFLGAEVVNPVLAALPLLRSSPYTRNRHDRFDLHFGMGLATDIDLSSPIGTVSTTVEAALRYLWNRTVDAESILGSDFTLDGYVTEDVFWRDTFARIVASGLGTSSGVSSFGPFPWQREDDTTDMNVSVDGTYAVFDVVDATAQAAEFIGYPTISEGELRIDLTARIGGAITNQWAVTLFPWRDDVSDAWCAVYIDKRLGGFWAAIAVIEGPGGGIISDAVSVTDGVRVSAKFRLALPGDEAAVAVWKPDTEDEPDYAFVDTMPAHTGLHYTPIFEVYAETTITPLSIDDVRVKKTDSDAARIYREFTLDAEARLLAINSSFTLNAIARATRSSSFTLNAVAKASRSGSFTLDSYVPGGTATFTLNALIRSSQTGSFTLDARVITETGLLLDHTLGTHELGGG